MAVMDAVSIPSSQRARRSAGGPPARSPAAPPIARGAKTAPFHSCCVELESGTRRVGESGQSMGVMRRVCCL